MLAWFHANMLSLMDESDAARGARYRRFGRRLAQEPERGGLNTPLALSATIAPRNQGVL
jgi:hypothetical protein